MKEQDLTKMEFLIKLNNNVVIQRYFNVKDYNPQARRSMELYENIRDIAESLQRKLKIKTVTYMLDNYYEIEENPQIIETSNTDGPETFNIYVRVNDETICHRVFDAKVYPPKVRYTMDIRPEAKNILRNLTDIFSEKNLTTEYLEISL
jgi:hypothetical protein